MSRNLATARRLSGGARQFATIKADAYGHGAVAVAKALTATAHNSTIPSTSEKPRSAIDAAEFADGCADGFAKGCADNIADGYADGYADGFAVVTVDEALELRQAGIEQPILVLQGPQSADACNDMHHYQLWPVIHDMYQYQWFRQLAVRERLQAWLKVDTGMGRLGVLPHQANDLLAANHGVNWYGVMTHFACADEPDNPFTDQQINTFQSVRKPDHLVSSMANSAAVLAWPQARADWSRPGIMLYGCNPLDRALPAGVTLEPAMRVTAPLIAKKLLPAGAGICYAQTWFCPEDMPVGYVALGYRDGLPRSLDATATVCIEGHHCPVVGRVSMDSIAVDLRSVPDVQPGAEVELWGESAPIDAIANSAGTISYELLTSIRGRREYI